jgi:hypothetical protein
MMAELVGCCRKAAKQQRSKGGQEVGSPDRTVVGGFSYPLFSFGDITRRLHNISVYVPDLWF